jgi:hypothetical protein
MNQIDVQSWSPGTRPHHGELESAWVAWEDTATGEVFCQRINYITLTLRSHKSVFVTIFLFLVATYYGGIVMVFYALWAVIQ